MKKVRQCKEISRRGFLQNGISLAAFILLAKCSFNERSPHEVFEEKLLGLFKNPESAKAVGGRYLKTVPEERDRRRLISRICPDFKTNPRIYLEMDDRQLRRWLRAFRKRDFVEGRTVEVNKWLLSITEARLCALVSLEPLR